MKEMTGSFIFKDDLHIESSLESSNEESLSELLRKAEKDILSLKTQILDLTNALSEKEKQKASIAEKLESLTSPKLEIKLNEPALHPGNNGRKNRISVRTLPRKTRCVCNKVSEEGREPYRLLAGMQWQIPSGMHPSPSKRRAERQKLS